MLNTRAGRDVEDVLWWHGDRLLGFVGLYAREEVARRVRLEVAVENERAVGLYTSLGFTQAIAEDCYRLGGLIG